MYRFSRYLFIIFYTLHINGIKRPKIVQQPLDVYGLLNQQVSLRCESTDSNDNISWFKDDRIVHIDSRLFVFQLNLESEGHYFCNVSNKYGWIMSEKALVRVAYLQSFPEQNVTEQYASPGATILLQCPTIEGLPLPNIDWQANKSLSDPRFKIGSGQDLRIDSVQRSDSGFYWCRAKNLAFTRFSSPIRLTIIQKPVFLLLPKHLRVMQGSSIVFPCLVTGEMPLLVNWYKLASSTADPSLSQATLASNCSLLLNNVRLVHTGAYVARATNRAGITEIVFKLSVISPPSFIDTPDNSRVSLGQSIILPCTTSGTPSPRVFWYHDNEYLVPDSDSGSSSSRVTIYDNGTLSITSVRTRDAGQYRCYAASFVGLSRTHCFLSVVIPTMMFAPVIVVPPHNITIIEGSTAVLTCRVLDSSHATITWYKQSLRIMALNSARGRHHLLSNGDLKISHCKIQDSATYTCRASIGNLYSDKSALLSVKSYSELSNDHPLTNYKEVLESGPVNVSVDFIGDTYLLVKWDFHGSSHTPLSRVEVAAQFINDWIEVAVTRETRVLITNLRPDTGYKVLVRAAGSVALLSDVVYTLDKPTVAVDSTFVDFHKALQDIEISAVRLSPVSSSQIHVTWKVRGGSILRSVSGFIIKTEPVSIRRCLLMTQKMGQALSSCLDQEDPAVDIDSLISQYENDQHVISSLKVHKHVVQRSLDRDRAKATAIVGDLRPFVCYEVEVETYIDHVKAGRISGRDSMRKTVLTYDDLPAKSPRIIRHHWLDNDTFLVAWDKLDIIDSNGPITGYVLQMINMVDKSLHTFKVPRHILEYKIKVESAKNRHVLYVSANSCRGPGPRSTAIPIEHSSPTKLNSETDLTTYRQWIISMASGASICALFIIIILVFIFLCRRRRSARAHRKLGQIPLVSSTDKDMAHRCSGNRRGTQLLVSNYDSLSPHMINSSDGFSCEHCPSSGTTTIPQFSCEDHKSLPSSEGTCSDSLAYASSSIIYKGCQHYQHQQHAINMIPPSYYGPYIDILSEQRNHAFTAVDPAMVLNPLIPPPPLYPPPPAPINQRNYSENTPEGLSGSHNNTHSSGSTSACGSSSKSNKTRKSRTPQSVNQSLQSSSSSKSRKNQPKTIKSSRSNLQNNSSPSIAGDYKKKDSQSNSTSSSQKTGALSLQTFVTNNHAPLSQELQECVHDDQSEMVLTSEISDTDTAPCDMEGEEEARDTDSLRVMYKLPVKRPLSPDYSTDSSYPYSLANHYSSAEPTSPKHLGNLPTKF